MKVKKLVALLCAFAMMILPVSAANEEDYGVTPCFDNISSVYITLAFKTNNMVYCGLDVTPYSHCSGVSGLMFLWDEYGNNLGTWPVSDYEYPIGVEFSAQGSYGVTYRAEFTGYAYSNNGTPPDRIEIETTAKLVY